MEPSVAIVIIETDLRYLIGDASYKTWGPDWLNRVFREEQVAELKERHSSEKSRRVPFKVSDDLLAYTSLIELHSVLERNWEVFAAVLGKQKEFDVLIKQVEDYRNAIAHSRELLPHERTLLEGIAGVIRTKVTIYRSEKGGDIKHYPVIESVHDSFGNAIANVSTDGQSNIVETGLKLTLGQSVTFSCRGWDPQERELVWSLIHRNGFSAVTIGTEVDLEWVVMEENVRLNCYIEIELTSRGRFHRFGGYDHRVAFRYEVEPPPVAPAIE